MHILVCVLVALVASVAPVAAQTEVRAAVSWEAAPLPSIKPVQIALSAERIERFLASLPGLIALARDLDREQGRAGSAKLDDNFAFLLAPYLFDPKIETDVNTKLEAFGFETYADWANTAHSLALAAEAAAFADSLDLKVQEEAARREIENDAKLSPEEKAKSLEELESQFAALAEFEPLPGNREIAAPYFDRLRAITGG